GAAVFACGWPGARGPSRNHGPTGALAKIAAHACRRLEDTMRTSTILSALPLSLLLLSSTAAQEVMTGEDAFGTWEPDAPGVRRLITPDDLPAPSLAENDPEAPDFENM